MSDQVQQPKRIRAVMESDGSISMRRCLAVVFTIMAAGMFYLGILHAKEVGGWWVFIPGTVCVIAVLLLLFFTTWSDITAVIQAAAGIAPKSPPASSSGTAAVDSPGR